MVVGATGTFQITLDFVNAVHNSFPHRRLEDDK